MFSQLLDKIGYSNTISKATPCLWGSEFPLVLSKRLPDLTGIGKSKMSAAKLEIPKSERICNILSKFRRLYLCFRDLAIEWD